ncbi:MAG: hypothetical protein ABI217_12255 [Chthoniobacterales bacterium]
MKTNARSKQQASALVVAMLVLVLVATFAGIAVNLTSATMRGSDNSRDFSALKSSAEGEMDFAYGVWAATINNYFAPVTKAQLASSLATVPAFTGMSYAPDTENGPLQINAVDIYGQPMVSTSATPSPMKINLPNYPGWVGTSSNYLVSVRLVATTNSGRTMKYGAKRTMNYAVVPLFQSTAFFEDTLELYKTATMSIGGLVHTNNTAYVSSGVPGALTFTGQLSYVKGYNDSVAPPKADTWSGYTPNSALPPTFPGGFSTQASQVSRIEPLGANSAALLSTTDGNPNNDSMRELIEPPNASFPDPSPIAGRRIYNKAGIRIRVTSTTDKKGKVTVTSTVTTQNGASLTAAQVTALQNSITIQTVYDRREGTNLSVATMDMSAAKTVFNAATGFNGIVYIDQTDSSGNVSSSSPMGVRLANGTTLPTAGLTVGSQNPVYIQGDYNTSGVKPPSAVYADALTVLSNSWSDGNSANALSSRQASSTTVNTAIVAGFLPSGWTNPNTNVQYGYSGGLNNFPRFLEDWSGDAFTFNGSMIELFSSQVAIGEWDTGSIYVPPNRIWNFDPQFVNSPPPGSLDAVSIARGALARF